jgi:hypothetical protein
VSASSSLSESLSSTASGSGTASVSQSLSSSASEVRQQLASRGVVGGALECCLGRLLMSGHDRALA